MHIRTWMAPLAGALLLFGTVSCGDNKAVETTAEDNTASGDTAVVMNDGTASADPEAMYRMRGRRIADRVYTDLHMTDTTMRSRLATTYYSRAKRYGEMRTKYASDTAGQYQAMRQAEMDFDKELQTTVLTDPAMYKEYEAHRMDYTDDKYLDDDASSMSSSDGSMNGGADMPKEGMGDGSMQSGSADASGSMEGSGDGKAKVKIKGEDGSKLKIKKGDVKVKDADGEKTKINGD